MKRFLLALVALALIIPALKSQSIKTPDEFLGYELGTQFTYQHKAVEYFKYIADISLQIYRLWPNIVNMGKPMKEGLSVYALFLQKKTSPGLKNTERTIL